MGQGFQEERDHCEWSPKTLLNLLLLNDFVVP